MTLTKKSDLLWEMPQPLGLYAGDLFERASEYRRAYQSLVNTKDLNTPYAAHFLLQHSVELYLKAFLASKGATKSELRKNPLRHDLNALLVECGSRGAWVSQEMIYLTRDIHENSRDHDFRYPTGYNLRVPSPRLVGEVLDPFVEKIGPSVHAANVEAMLLYHAEIRHLIGTGAKVGFSD